MRMRQMTRSSLFAEKFNGNNGKERAGRCDIHTLIGTWKNGSYNRKSKKQRKEICDKTDEIQKLQNEITDMCHDVFELRAGVKELKNENKELRELVCDIWPVQYTFLGRKQ